jgi:molybdopterin synthase catalytic subunit
MRIQVLYFAVFRERLGTEGEAISLHDGATVAEAITALAERHAAIATLRGKFRVAVNQEFSTEDRALADGDEIALIPPVAGGARHVALRPDAISIERCVAAVTGPDHGAIITFTGTVRRENRGLTIERLEYEAYEPMAIRVMTALCDEIEAEIPGAAVAVEHRVGTLAIGDVAVVIAAAAPHRAEAFTACRAMIDRLKDRVPIWKKEIADTGAEWIGLGP